nr:transposase [Blautia obeum]
MILSIRSSFKKLLVLQRDYLMVLGEKHGTNYLLYTNRRSYLSTYLEDGRCSFSNNLSENAIRPFTVGRKNWLFCDTPNGAQASAIVYTMVEMAKANGVNVYHYLTYLLEKLPDDRMSDDELELLAPWNETVKAEIERRANESNQSYVNCQGALATEK